MRNVRSRRNLKNNRYTLRLYTNREFIVNESNYDTEFAKETAYAKINPNFDKGEIMANEMHRNVNHTKTQHLG